MFHSIELRVPLLSKGVIKYSENIEHHNSSDKKILRELLKNNLKLNDNITNSKRKVLSLQWQNG